MNYSIYWTIPKHDEFASAAPFLDLQFYDEVLDDPLWPDGYRVWEFDLSGEQFGTVDTLCNQLTAIDIKPSPRPPWSPTGR